MSDIDQLKYPVGKFMNPDIITNFQIKSWIEEIKDLPGLIEVELRGLPQQDLLKTYRPGGWTITQVIHHLADSHMNSFIRYKLALTEDSPAIKGYDEHQWGEMADNKTLEPHHSLAILTPLHIRWGYLLDHMKDSDFEKGYFHPDKKRVVPLSEATALYAWHCRHHLAHIRNAKNTQ